MTNSEIAQACKKLYHQFLRENNVTPETAYANILWKWHGYLNEHKTW